MFVLTMERVLSHDTAKSTSRPALRKTRSNLLSAICYLLFHSRLAARMNWARQDLFGDLCVRYGIKVALAGLLALFCAQLLRLPSANWAIVTVIALMRPQFVGASAFKSIMRAAGTLGGAIIGVWLVGDFLSTPAILLPILFLVLALAGYKFGQLGARQVPYAYFLLGVTTLVVVSDGIMNPDQVWQIGLSRTEEIFVGIICSLLVTTVVWPRYAQKEFLVEARQALKTIGELVSLRTRANMIAPNQRIASAEICQRCRQQLSDLGNLLHAASRETTVLSVRDSNYPLHLASLNSLFHAVIGLDRYPVGPPPSRLLHEELDSVWSGILQELDILTNADFLGQELQSSSMDDALTKLEAKVNHIRLKEISDDTPGEALAALAGYLGSLRLLCDELSNIRGAILGRPLPGRSQPRSTASFHAVPVVDWFWIKVGIKGGFAAVLAIVFLSWIHPPGGASTPAWAWLLIVLGRPFFRVGGTGDLRAFQTTVVACLILCISAALTIFISPLLADYTFMNLVLFIALFALGFLTTHLQGLNFWTEFTALTVSAFVALNPQEPVPAQTTIGTYLGLMFGVLIAAVIGRLFWPVLPQRILRDSLLDLLAGLKALVSGDPRGERIRAQLEILPLEALSAVRQNRVAGFSQREKCKMRSMIEALQGLAPRTQQLTSRREKLPESVAAALRLHFECLEFEFDQVLSAFEECLRVGDCDRVLPSFTGALAGLDLATQQLCDRGVLADQTLEASLQVLGLIDRYHAVGDSLSECGRLLQTLELQRYWGDYFL